MTGSGRAPEGRERGPWLRPRGGLSRSHVWVLAILAALPLLTIAFRILALPGIAPGWTGVAAVGDALNRGLSLSDIPAGQRDHVLYLLFVPTCALLVTFANLTLGLPVLGFRSILMAVAFHQCGPVASLIVIAIAVLAILLLRPWLQKIRLPYYGRVSVILCVVSVTLVGAVVVGPLVRSDLVWGMAYFPVIVLGMLAEGIARTVSKHDAVRASWLAINTVLLAFVMALACQIPILRSFLLRFPEVVLTQIVAVIMIAEYLDLRLLGHWDRRFSGFFGLLARPSAPRVAIVRNRLVPTGTTVRRIRHRLALRSVRKIAEALRQGGYTVKILEGDASLARELRRFFPVDPSSGGRPGVVFNLAQGATGDAPPTHVPAVLEMSGLAYCGPTPLGHAVTFDPVLARVLMHQAKILTPAFRVVADSGKIPAEMRYPLAVRARHEPAARPRIVAEPHGLRRAVKRIVRRRREAFIEECVGGRKISVGLIGNDPPRCLPPVELDAVRGVKICPAPLEKAVARRVRACAKAAFRACGCRDYARVDVRVGESGEVRVVDIRTLGILARRGSFVRAARRAGYTFDELVCGIVEMARARGLSSAASRSPADVVVVTERPREIPAVSR